MSDNLQTFRDKYLNARSWGQRKDGVPLFLLDELSPEELKIAEEELLDKLDLRDDWPINGLGHIKSQKALSKLYDLLKESSRGMKISIAHSIFQISDDKEMIEIVLVEMPKLKGWTEIIHMLYLLPTFNDDRTDQMLDDYREHKDYLVAYNATRVMGLPTEKVVEKFRNERSSSLWNKIILFFKL